MILVDPQASCSIIDCLTLFALSKPNQPRPPHEMNHVQLVLTVNCILLISAVEQSRLAGSHDLSPPQHYTNLRMVTVF